MRWGIYLLSLFLVGCASSEGMGLRGLETTQYLRAERAISMDFVEIQRALFRHQAACKTDIQWAGEPNLANYVRIIKPFTPGATGWSNTMVLGLTHMVKIGTRAELFSYHTPSSAQVEAMYGAILDPENCQE